MSTKKKPTQSAKDELIPNFVYRKHSDIALGIIGLGPTQVNEAIARGELPRPVKLTPSGRAVGWTGRQLIELQRQRLAEVEAAAKHETT